MPRLSNLQILKNTARNVLNEVRNKLNPRTFNAYLDKIFDKDRKDTIKKIIDELQYVKEQTATNITLPKVKVIRVRREGLKKALPKFSASSDVGSIAFFTKKRFTYNDVKTRADMYYAILDAGARSMPDYQFITLHTVPKGEQLSSDNSNRVKSFNIRVDDMTTYNTFIEAVDKITSGEFQGSDQKYLDINDVVLNIFDLSRVQAAGNGSSDKMMFKVEGVEQTKYMKNGRSCNAGDCGKVCLRKIIKDEKILQDLEYRNVVEFRTLEGLKNYIEMWGLEIDIIANSFLVKRMVNEIVKDGEEKLIMIEDVKRKGLMRRYICSTMRLDTDIEVVYFNKVFKPIATIIYDEFNEHFDIIKNNKIELDDDVYISAGCNIIKNGKVLFTPREINKNSRAKAPRPIKDKFVFFDYETVLTLLKIVV
jgi:hypothetical protein